MKLTAYPKTIFCLALLLGWGNCAPPAMAQGSKYIEIHSWAPLQTVEVQTPRDSYHAVFESMAQVFPRGVASGFLKLSGEVRAPRPDDEVLVVFVGGSARFAPDGSVAGVVLRGRTAEGDPVVVMITPAASEDCLIYTTVGSGVQATWEAQGQIVVNR